AVTHHVRVPRAAARGDLADRVPVTQVAQAVGSRPLLDLLHALAIADALATGPAAWNDWKAGLVSELVRRVGAALGREPPPAPLPLRAEQIALAAAGEPRVLLNGSEVTVVAPHRPGP